MTEIAHILAGRINKIQYNEDNLRKSEIKQSLCHLERAPLGRPIFIQLIHNNLQNLGTGNVTGLLKLPVLTAYIQGQNILRIDLS